MVETRALQIDEARPALTSEQTLTGWRREFCVEILGEGQARIFLRAVESPSLKAAELRRAILFHRVDNLFAAVTYDRRAWERVVNGVERWQRRPRSASRRDLNQ